MSLDKRTRFIQPDPRAVRELAGEFNEGLRLSARTVKPLPNRLFSRIGEALDPGRTPGNALSIAHQAGAPLAHLEEAFHRGISVVRSWFPADLTVSLQSASVAEQVTDGPVDLWQVSLREQADEFTLRRGIALAVEQRQALDQMIDVLRHRVAERQAQRRCASPRPRPQRVAR